MANRPDKEPVGSCQTCWEVFNSDRAFDKHRVGQHNGGPITLPNGKGGYAPGNRRCLTPDEMRAIGMSQNPGGKWIASTFDAATLARLYPGSNVEEEEKDEANED